MLKLLEGCISPAFGHMSSECTKIIEHGEFLMDLYTQEDIQREKRMALLQRTAVAAVFVAIILAIWSL